MDAKKDEKPKQGEKPKNSNSAVSPDLSSTGTTQNNEVGNRVKNILTPVCMDFEGPLTNILCYCGCNDFGRKHCEH